MVKSVPSVTPIVLAGGFGTWAQYHFDRPKQFVIREYTSLYQDTLDRIRFMEPPLVVSNVEHTSFINEQSSTVLDTIFEPVARNTGAAVMIACLTLKAAGHTHALILPSDHVIRDTLAFQNDVEMAIHHIGTHDMGILFGVPAHHPSSHFGYIQTDHFGNVVNFIEKPDINLAANLLQSTYRTYWNSGIFMAAIDRLLAYMFDTCPDFMAACQAAYDAPTLDHYMAIPNIPFDTLYLEQMHDLFCIEAEFDWMDTGTPETIKKAGATHE